MLLFNREKKGNTDFIDGMQKLRYCVQRNRIPSLFIDLCVRRERESRDFDKMSEKVQEMNVSVVLDMETKTKKEMDLKTFMKDNKNAFFEVELRRSAVSGKSHSKSLSY